ncbi:MAG: TrbC/VirB2 family protein [Rhodospirillum sp.]|nr:TrbC/VirB2 family protein [Rhodospirillum sp.]MCF8501779.1 TrbC/VirB2 family protein [Rhodospirillum sp.]
MILGKHLTIRTIGAIVATHLLTVGPAMAADDWAAPGVSLAESLESGMVKIGAALIGLGIIVVGFILVMTQRMQADKIGYVIAGGILIMAGPTMLRALLAATGG